MKLLANRLVPHPYGCVADVTHMQHCALSHLFVGQANSSVGVVTAEKLHVHPRKTCCTKKKGLSLYEFGGREWQIIDLLKGAEHRNQVRLL